MKHKNTKKGTIVVRRLKKFLPLVAIVFLMVCGFIPALKPTRVDGLAESSQAATTNSSTKAGVKNTTNAVAVASAQRDAAKAAAAASAASKVATASAAASTSASSATTTAYTPVTTASPRGMRLYVDPSQAQSGRPSAITSQSIATWLGSWNTNVQATVNSTVSAASASGTIATFVLYNIPGRDCGSYSAGGLSGVAAYNTWVGQVAAGIGQRQAIVIIEPDALAQIDCLSPSLQSDRYAMLSNAVSTLASQTKAFTYLDAGNSNWVDSATMATRLQKANVAQARGFSLNVSNFFTTSSNTTFGNQIASRIGKSFVIDTSRNGNGSNGDWCNPSGRALGARPTTSVGGNVDAYLWVKAPGESDGTCNGGPSAGTWWEQYAETLVSNS